MLRDVAVTGIKQAETGTESGLSEGAARAVALGAGFIALDIVQNGDDQGLARVWAGGTCGNVLAILSYLGWETYPATVLGQDAAGTAILEDLRRFGVKFDIVQFSGKRRTPIVLETVLQGLDGQGRHKFGMVCPICGRQLPRYHPLRLSDAIQIGQTALAPGVFFFDRVSRGTLHLAELFAAKGALVVFEPSAIGDKLLFQEAIKISHVVKYSSDRLSGLTGVSVPPRTMEIKTFGSLGLRYRLIGKHGQGEWKKLDAFRQPLVRDPAGSGDWCTAGFIHGLLHERVSRIEEATMAQIERSLNLGQALAAINCAFYGARGLMYGLTADEMGNLVTLVLESRGLAPLKQLYDASPYMRRVEMYCPSCHMTSDAPGSIRTT